MWSETKRKFLAGNRKEKKFFFLSTFSQFLCNELKIIQVLVCLDRRRVNIRENLQKKVLSFKYHKLIRLVLLRKFGGVRMFKIWIKKKWKFILPNWIFSRVPIAEFLRSRQKKEQISGLPWKTFFKKRPFVPEGITFNKLFITYGSVIYKQKLFNVLFKNFHTNLPRAK